MAADPNFAQKQRDSDSEIRAVDKSAFDKNLFPEIYDELKRIARAYMRRERSGHTLQPTALVHQAYVRLVAGHPIACENQTHLLALAARAMRHILTDHAVARHAGKRGGGGIWVTLDDGLAIGSHGHTNSIALNEAMERLEQLDERQTRVAELRIFGGMSFDEIGFTLGVSSRTAKRDWTIARAYLRQQLSRTV
jgi:RNA polymerase sigma-70 factor (ECF subfamily)